MLGVYDHRYDLGEVSTFMKIVKKNPDPFYYQGNNKIGLLLIHGFTGTPAEMKLLGKYLHQHGYTVYAPLLTGHGKTPEEMAKTNHKDWWNSVTYAYDFLKEEGYEKIVSVGLSMGGVLSLKLAYKKPLSAVVAMAAPIYVHDKRMGWARWIKYVKTFQPKVKKEAYIEEHLVAYDRTPIACVGSLDKLIKEVKRNLQKIMIPAFIMQGKKDETVYYESASYIYEHVGSTVKEISWYEDSTHIMTLDREREQVFSDIRIFLEKLKLD